MKCFGKACCMPFQKIGIRHSVSFQKIPKDAVAIFWKDSKWELQSAIPKDSKRCSRHLLEDLEWRLPSPFQMIQKGAAAIPKEFHKNGHCHSKRMLSGIPKASFGDVMQFQKMQKMKLPFQKQFHLLTHVSFQWKFQKHADWIFPKDSSRLSFHSKKFGMKTAVWWKRFQKMQLPSQKIFVEWKLPSWKILSESRNFIPKDFGRCLAIVN